MAIEKRASEPLTQQNIKELVKQANEAEETLVINMTSLLKKAAIVVVATGPRAEQLRAILEACD